MGVMVLLGPYFGYIYALELSLHRVPHHHFHLS